MNPYGSLARGSYTNEDVAAELRRSGGHPAQSVSDAYANYAPTEQVNYGMLGSAATPMESYPSQAPSPQTYSGQQPAETPKDLFEAFGGKDGKLTRAEFERAMASYGQTQNIDPKILEGAVDVKVREGRVVSERMVEQRSQVIAGVKPVYTVEKVVEVPQVIVREYEREVLRPEVVERIIEVPKTEIQERKIVGPPQVQYQEQIVEVPQVVVEERVVHVPKREIQERLIEVPKVEYVERIEYEDFIEYREVPVDKIVEVPEIEYRVREVEYLVPQTYIQEYYVDRYREFPVTQVQEVERIEHVPVEMPLQAKSQYMQQTGVIPSASMTMQTAPAAAMAPAPAPSVAAPVQSTAVSAAPTPVPTQPQGASQVNLGAAYTTYSTSVLQGQPVVYGTQPGTMQAQPMTYAVPAPAPAGSVVFSQPMQSVQYVQAPVQTGATYSYATYDPSKMFDVLDKNGDGVLTAAEVSQAMQRPTASMASMPVGSQYIMPRGSAANLASMGPAAQTMMSPMASGAMTPPMAPGYNPYGSNPFQSAPPGSVAAAA